MKNTEVQFHLDSCKTELDHVSASVLALGITSAVVPYLTSYSVIRACGAIEVAFKALITDFCVYRSKKQVKRFIHKRVRDGSANPNHDNIVRFLKDFDEAWEKDFRKRLNLLPNKAELLGSLQSLVNARNEFAHGGSPSLSIGDVMTHFDNSREVIRVMDEVIG